jgi:hypothetical protein
LAQLCIGRSAAMPAIFSPNPITAPAYVLAMNDSQNEIGKPSIGYWRDLCVPKTSSGLI